MSTTIIIIGGSASGTLLAIHLLRLGGAAITLVDDAPVLGSGPAYRTPFDCHVLNVRAGGMSAFADRPSDFVEWLATNPATRAFAANDFVPRHYYGDYLRARLDEARTRSVASTFRWCRQRALHAESREGVAHITLSDGETLRGQYAVLALGNFPPADPPAVAALAGSPQYVGYAWGVDALARLPKSGPVLLIGSGLTMVDCVLELRERGRSGSFHVVSRHGRLPAPHAADTPRSFSRPSAPSSNGLRQMLREIRALLACSPEGDWRSLIDGLRPHTQALWERLSPSDRARFLRHVRPHWDASRHRVPPAPARVIDGMLNDGSLSVHAGTVTDARVDDGSAIHVSVRRRGGLERLELEVSSVINCSGPEGDVRKLTNPLVAGLLRAGILSADPTGLGIRTTVDGRAITAEGQPLDWLLTAGPMRKAALWESTAIPEIREQAQTLAARLCAQASETFGESPRPTTSAGERSTRDQRSRASV